MKQNDKPDPDDVTPGIALSLGKVHTLGSPVWKTQTFEVNKNARRLVASGHGSAA
ncbi:MAG TPA: hypothetical protein VN755_11410 [Steroidobacteraceae bacterium]|nr:hypothetical protein [Steroidobacteraceae bacterium]